MNTLDNLVFVGKARHKALYIGRRAPPGSALGACNLCNGTILTHEHLLWDCPLAKFAWDYVVRKSTLPSYTISSVTDVLEIGGVNLRDRSSPISTITTVRMHMYTIHCIIATMRVRSSSRTPVTLVAGRIMIRQMIDRWLSLVTEATLDYVLPRSLRRR